MTGVKVISVVYMLLQCEAGWLLLLLLLSASASTSCHLTAWYSKHWQQPRSARRPADQLSLFRDETGKQTIVHLVACASQSVSSTDRVWFVTSYAVCSSSICDWINLWLAFWGRFNVARIAVDCTMFRIKLRKIIPYINKQVLREKNGRYPRPRISLHFINFTCSINNLHACRLRSCLSSAQWC
jgi:hypothetical protein